MTEQGHIHNPKYIKYLIYLKITDGDGLKSSKIFINQGSYG